MTPYFFDFFETGLPVDRVVGAAADVVVDLVAGLAADFLADRVVDAADGFLVFLAEVFSPDFVLFDDVLFDDVLLDDLVVFGGFNLFGCAGSSFMNTKKYE